jgi:hypothetical protein
MRQEVCEEDAEDWVGEAEGDEGGAGLGPGGGAQQRRGGGGGAGGRRQQRKRARGGGDGDEEMADGGSGGDDDDDEDGGAGGGGGAAGRAERAARRGDAGPAGAALRRSDWPAVGRAMHAGQAARQRAGEPTGELSLAELQAQLRAAGVAASDASLVALLEAASAAFGDLGAPEAAQYAGVMPNFMWLAEDRLVSFMS